MEVILNNEAEMAVFAAKFFSELQGGESIGLIGNLGAGKTTFVRHFAKAAGVPASQVSSPSFVLSYEYRGDKFKIDHWDIYRINDAPEELWEPPAKDEIRLIEWVDKVDELKLEMDLIIKIDFIDLKTQPEARRIEIIRK